MNLSQTDHNQSFKILSLDGGGIRGAFTASVLADLEDTLERPLSDYFDLIAGTSTGAIIGAAIAFGIPARRVCEFYETRGRAIFSKRWFSYWGFTQSKYSNVELKNALADVFGEQILEHSKCRLLIPAVNLTGQPNVVFKTPHQPGFKRDRVRLIVDVLMATTAAPTCFPQTKLSDGIYADGGLWANNPSMAAYSEAAKIIDISSQQNHEAPFGLDDVKLLSIGTGESSKFLQPLPHETGGLWWGADLKLLDVMGKSQSAGSHFQAGYVLGDRYKRVNFKIPDGEKWSLDAVDKIDELLKQGKRTALEENVVIKKMFLTTVKRPYLPYPLS